MQFEHELRYQHENHAGNFADVHKHWVLELLLKQIQENSGEIHYLESHAGAGRYYRSHSVDDSFATGIAKVWQQPLSARSLIRYREGVKAVNPGEKLRHYPGSPLIAAKYLRANDRGTLIEQDAQAFAYLTLHLKQDARFKLLQGDCFALLADHLPHDRSWLLLVDPPFTEINEFLRIAEWLVALWQSHPGGIIALWYPLVAEGHEKQLVETLSHQLPVPTLTTEFQTRDKTRKMFGSGMRIINPPHGLTQQLERDASEMAALLGGKLSVKFVEGKSEAAAPGLNQRRPS